MYSSPICFLWLHVWWDIRAGVDLFLETVYVMLLFRVQYIFQISR